MTDRTENIIATARNLTLEECVIFNEADEILRRLKRGRAFIGAKEEDVIQEAFDAGAEQENLATRESVIGDVIDFINGEVWMEGMTDDQRYFLTEDLCLYVTGADND
jgi:hypothetical protein